MHRYSRKRTEEFIVLIVVLLLGGCAPGLPPPPVPFSLFSAGMGWIGAALLVGGAFLLWKKFNSIKATKTDHLTDTLNAISDRLSALEEKMNQPERDKENQ